MAQKYTDDELLDHLRAVAEELDGSPTAAELTERGPPSADTYKRRFGSWNDALRAAGLAVNRERDISVDDLLAEIRRLADDLGRVPLAVDVTEHGAYSLDPYVDRFDSWSEAVAAAGFAVRRAGSAGSAAPPDSAGSAAPAAAATANVAHLREHGPVPVGDLPDGALDTADRVAGAAKFELAGGRAAVAYLHEEHDETAVVRAFLAANPALLDDTARHNLVQLFGSQGRRWRDAARPVLDDLDSSRTGDR